MSFRFVLAALVFAPAFSASSFAADGSLTLPEAQRLALARSLQVVAQDAAVSASRHMSVAAGQLPDPMLKAGVDNVPVTGPDRFSLGNDFMTMRRVGVMQEITRGEKRRLRAERYDREADKSLAERQMTIAAIQRDTALAWLDRYYAEAMAQLIDEQVTQARLEIETAEAAYRAARGNHAHVFAAHAPLSALQDRASEYRRRVGAAKIAMARWVGDAAQAPLGPRPSFDSVHLHHGGGVAEQVERHPMVEVMNRRG